MPYDLEIRSEGERVAAVEVKAHRQKITPRIQVETLAVAALLRREVSEVFIVTPKDWERAMPAMAHIRDALDLDGVRLVTLNEDKAERDHIGALEFW